ncbi:MAG: NAD-dependent epimerase/dehydratase [Frankiales bacterium]|nr:NAD-dependent epimerase/dehydratase [Frankiales bacterium]
MHVLLTGGTGFVGTGVLDALLTGGHDVTAVARSEQSAKALDAAGATPVLGDMTDVAWFTAQLRAVDGAVHTATPGDETGPDFDRAAVTAVAAAFAGTGKPYVHTGGIWVYGDGDDISEDTPFNPPAITAWREPVERTVLGIQGARVSIVVPAIVYGHGKGIPNVISRAPRSEDRALLLVGDGRQHWATVHVDDLADLYVRVLTAGRNASYYLGVAGNPTVRELGEAASRATGSGAVVADSVENSRARLGESFADALLMDQQATGARARTELGWIPTRRSLSDELTNGSYLAG